MHSSLVFHAVVKTKKLRMVIYHIKNEDNFWVNEVDQIQFAVISFFSKILSQEYQADVADHILRRIISVVTNTDNHGCQNHGPTIRISKIDLDRV